MFPVSVASRVQQCLPHGEAVPVQSQRAAADPVWGPGSPVEPQRRPTVHRTQAGVHEGEVWYPSFMTRIMHRLFELSRSYTLRLTKRFLCFVIYNIHDCNGVPLLLVDRQMALVRNYAIQSTGSSIVYTLTLDCLGNKTTHSQQRTRNVVWLCVVTKGDILPWSQPSCIHQWILVINLNGPNGSRRSTLTEIHTHVTHCHTVTEWVSVRRDWHGWFIFLLSPLQRTGLRAANSQIHVLITRQS